MLSDPIEALQLLIESSLSEVNTNMPGTVVSYDAARNRAVVRPDLPKRLNSQEALDPPQVVEVPVVWHASGAGNASFTMPLKPGDGVMLAVQQRSLEGWLSGQTTMPDDPRQFDLSDCVAIPGCAHSGTVGHPENVVLKFGNASLTIQPDGAILLGNSKASITLGADGTMTLHAQTVKVSTPGNSYTMETHHHSDPQGGNVGIPI